MSAQATDFNRGAIRPMECISEGWQLVKEQYWLMLGITFVGLILGSLVPLGIILGAMMCGIHMCLFALMRRQQFEFNLLFKGFDLFVPSLIVTAIQIVPMIIVIVPLYIVFMVLFIAGSAAGNSPEMGFAMIGVMLVFYVVVIAVSLAIHLFFMFAYQLVADRQMNGVDACKLSAKAVMGNFGGAVGLLFLNALLSIIGVFACYVGAILYLPISFAATDVAYRQVFPEIDPTANAQSPYNPPPQYPNYGQHYPPQQ